MTKLFKETEPVIKNAEHLTGKLSILSVNKLRYAALSYRRAYILATE